MTSVLRTTPAAGQVLILAADEFGHEVADRLTGIVGTPSVLDVGPGTHESLWPYADLIILATGSPRPVIADAVDRTAFHRTMPWFPVHARPSEVQCGPVVVPGRTACHQCAEKRRAQHRRSTSGSAVVVPPAAFSYARHHAVIATALAHRAILEAAGAGPPKPPGATVRTFNYVSGTMSEVPVVAVDGCRRCRGRFGSIEEERGRLWATLAAASDGPPAVLPIAVGSGA